MPKHILGMQDLELSEVENLLESAQNFVEINRRDIKKVPSLRGKTVISLFLENSTRTRASFELAGKRMSADVINVAGSSSSIKKGESFLDTARSLQAMTPDVLVIRHSSSGAGVFMSRFLKETSIINAGDGMHEHPSQAMLNLLSLKQHFKDRPDGVKNLKIAIVGDIRHSRVARSDIWVHKILGNEIRLVGPPTLVPPELLDANCFGSDANIHYTSNLVEGIKDVDVILVLRLQSERSAANFIPSLQEYINEYQVNEALVEKHAPNAVVMHAGPINRGVEVQTRLIDGERSLVEKMVENGVAVRMAMLLYLCTGQQQEAAE